MFTRVVVTVAVLGPDAVRGSILRHPRPFEVIVELVVEVLVGDLKFHHLVVRHLEDPMKPATFEKTFQLALFIRLSKNYLHQNEFIYLIDFEERYSNV